MKVIDRNTNKIYDTISQAARECGFVTVTIRTLQKTLKEKGNYKSIYPYDGAENVTTEKVERHRIHDVYSESELDRLIEIKNKQGEFEVFKIEPQTPKGKNKKVGVALLSDIHIDEVVKKASVMGLNEYNDKIAKQRITKFFEKIVRIVNRNPVDELILGCLGDVIGGFIHEELQQTNSMSPLQGVQLAKSCIISGINYLIDSLDVSQITFVGVCGNHGRTTRRKQFANGWQTNYEYFLYKDIELYFASSDKVKFVIPEAEMAIIDVIGHKILMAHGDQFKYCGGIGGIFPAMLRWFSKISTTFDVYLACIGHYHASNFTDKVITNGSIKGYDSFAMSHGMQFEKPQQTFFIIDEKKGLRLYCPIFVE